MKLSDILAENAQHTLMHAIDNAIHKIRIEKSDLHPEDDKKKVEDLVAEINNLKELKDRLEYGHAAKDFWTSIPKKTKDRLPMTQPIKDFLQ